MKPLIIAGPQNISAALHQSVVLECLAEGNPRPLVSWSRADSKPIDVSGARVLGNGNLIISAVKAHHSGTYLCRATTPGTRNYSTAHGNLTVLGKRRLLDGCIINTSQGLFTTTILTFTPKTICDPCWQNSRSVHSLIWS